MVANKKALLRLREVMSRVGIRSTNIYERVKTGDFPRPVKISG